MRVAASVAVSPSFFEAAQSQASEASPGLVPYKTTAQQQIVNLASRAVAERRVAGLKRSVWSSGHLHPMAENGFRPAVPWFVTLTYHPDVDWRPEHIASAVKRFRNWCRSQGVECRYTWVAELQQRGAVHYHLLAWLPPGRRMPQWDRPTRKRGGHRSPFWPHGMSNTELARSGVGYLMKYLSKLGELTRFPKGLRLYGIGGLSKAGRMVRGWYNLPQWAKAAYGVGELVRKKAGLVVRATGEILPAVWRVSRIPSGLLLTKLRDIPPRFETPSGEHFGAYSSFPRLAT